MIAKTILSLITAFLFVLGIYLVVTGKEIEGGYHDDSGWGWVHNSFNGYILLLVAIFFLVALIFVFKGKKINQENLPFFMQEKRQNQIERFAGYGDIKALKKMFEDGYTQLEIDTALENAIAYSQITTAEYLLSLGADLSNYGYNGVYYAVHNNELEGLKFAIKNDVDINVENGMLLNTAIMTATNTKSVELVNWLLENGANPSLLTDQSLKLIDDYGTPELKTLIYKAVHQ